jgi:very-short-patch-repair endonuclease
MSRFAPGRSQSRSGLPTTPIDRGTNRTEVEENLLVLDGWTVLRFTWQDVTDRPDQVLAAIFAALEAAA